MGIQNETFTATIEPFVNQDQMYNMLIEYFRDAGIGSVDSPDFRERYRGYHIAQSLVSLAGNRWIVPHASDTIYYNSDSTYPERLDCLENKDICMVSGKWAKRIKAIAFRMYHLDLPDPFIASLGETARRFMISTEDGEINMDITNCIDWDAGEFGDNGSCYWDEHADAKTTIMAAGGGAVRHFDPDGSGHSRCWILPYADGYVIFNAYGVLSLAQFATIVSQHFGYTKINAVALSNHGRASGMVYINNSAGYYIHPQGTQDRSDIDMEMTILGQCQHCGRFVDPNKLAWKNNRKVCEDCSATCYRCGKHTDSLIYCSENHKFYCPPCAKIRGVKYCAHCNTVVYNYNHRGHAAHNG